MTEIPFKTRRDMLLNNKTSCFTLGSNYDREPISVISYNQLIDNELEHIMTENQFFSK